MSQLLLPDAFGAKSQTDWRGWTVTVGNRSFSSSRLLATPHFEVEARLAWNGGPLSALRGNALVIIALDEEALALLAEWQRARRRPLLRIERHYPERDSAGRIVLWEGAAVRLERAGAALKLHGVRQLPGADTPLCRDAAALSGLEALPRNSFIPQVFGEHRDVVPVALHAPGDVARLRVALGADATEALLFEPADGWPNAGRVQIGDETLRYSSLVGGVTLGGLLRPSAREHRAGAPVWLLRDEDAPFVWIVCDHPAEVLSMRAGRDPRTAFPIEGIASVEELQGRLATFFRAPQAPVRRAEAASPVTREPELRFDGYWELLLSSFCDFAADGFADEPASPGAILSLLRPRLHVRWLEDLGRRWWRFDRIERAVLAFDMAPVPPLSPVARLRVSVTKGERSRSVDYNFEGLPVRAADPIPSHVAAPLEERRVLHFDSVQSLPLGWTGLGAAVDQRLLSEFTSIASPGVRALLRLGIERPWPEEDAAVTEVALHTFLRSLDLAPVRLTLRAPGVLLFSTDFTETAELTHRALRVPVPPGIALHELLRSLRADLELPAGGMIDVQEAWLEVRTLRQLAVPIAEQLRSRGISPSLPIVPVEFDVTELLANAFDWTFFGPEPTPAEVRFEWLESDEFSPVVLRRIHWKVTGYPASSVALDMNAIAHVRGRATEEDGRCAPLAVVRELATHADFAGAAVLPADEALWEAAADTVAARGQRFAAWFAEGHPVEEFLAAAAGEAFVLLSPHGEATVPLAMALDPEDAAPDAIDAGDALDGAARFLSSLPGELDFPPAVLRSADDSSAWSSSDAAARGAVRLRWTVAGGEVLPAAIRNWFARPRLTMELPVVPRQMQRLCGTAVEVGGAPARWRGPLGGILESIALQAAALPVLRVDSVLPKELWSGGGWRIVRRPISGAVDFVYDGAWRMRIVESGDLLLRGSLFADGDGSSFAGAAEGIGTAGGVLQLVAWPVVFALAPSGDAVLVGTLHEDAAIGDGWEGLPLRLEPGGLWIGGRLREG